jgi:hypothetical protein
MMNGRKPWIANIDMYRKMPGDLMEQSQQGSIVSLIAVFAMVILFFSETSQFLTPHLVTDLALDGDGVGPGSRLSKIRANFNITLTDVRCQVSTWTEIECGEAIVDVDGTAIASTIY